PPAANAGSDQTANEGTSVSLAGAGSDVFAGDTLTYQWQLVSSTNGQSLPTGNAANYTFTPSDNGTYTFRLTVTDDDGGSSTDDVVVTVNNVAPTANAGPDQTANEGSLTTLVGTGSDAASGDTLTYAWQLISSTNGQSLPPGSGTSFSFTPTDNGVYTLRLTVTDDDGDSAIDTVVVIVQNVAPTANAGSDQIVSEGSLVNLTGQGNDVGSADELSYGWRLVSSSNGQSVADANSASFAFTPADNGV